MTPGATPPSALARRIRHHLAGGGATAAVIPWVRDLMAQVEVLFNSARRDLRATGGAQLAGTVEAGDMILEMLRKVEHSLHGPDADPSGLLSFLAFAEKALRAQELGMSRTAATPPAATSQTLPRGRALLVEDEEAFLRVAGAWLREAGFEVIEVTRADVARPLLAEERWDLLFTDVVLPGGGDGFDLGKQAQSTSTGIAMVFASGFSPRRRPPEVQAWPLLRKPFRRAELMDAVNVAMTRAAQLARAAQASENAKPAG